jgi:hypothetical protein
MVYGGIGADAADTSPELRGGRGSVHVIFRRGMRVAALADSVRFI